jgi:hypothetical protein
MASIVNSTSAIDMSPRATQMQGLATNNSTVTSVSFQGAVSLVE